MGISWRECNIGTSLPQLTVLLGPGSDTITDRSSPKSRDQTRSTVVETVMIAYILVAQKTSTPTYSITR